MPKLKFHEVHKSPEKFPVEKRREGVQALLIGDTHFSHKPPIFRSVEEDWYEAMREMMDQLGRLQIECNNCPILIAGDILHTWKETPELINFLLHSLPNNIYAVPGNHDLRHASYEDLKATAFYTLVKAERIKLVKPGEPTKINDLVIYGFPCGYDLEPCPDKEKTFQIDICLAHTYVWTQGTNYPDAPEEQRLKELRKSIKGYDIYHFGDNHKSFLIKGKDCSFFNAGSLMIRNSDQLDHKPNVGLIHKDLSIEQVYLDCSKDKYLDLKKEQEKTRSELLDLNEFLEGLTSLESGVVKFRDIVERKLSSNKISKEVKQIILKSFEEAK